MTNKGPAEHDCAKSKGRAAQKRYRDRVKAKKEGMEDQVAVLSRRVAELEATHSSLEGRNRSLERYMELSNEKDSRERNSSGHVPNEAEEKNVDRTVREWHRLYVASINKMRSPEGPIMTPEESLANFPDPKHFQAVKREACMRLYQLMGYTLDPGEAEKQRASAFIQHLRQSRLELMKYMHLAGKTSLTKGLMMHSLVNSKDAMPSAMPALTRSMELNEEQKHKILEAKRKFCEECALIRVQREGILEQLRQNDQSQQATASVMTFYGQINSAQEAQDQLQESLQKEISAMSRFASAWTDAVNTWQEARVVVEAYIKHDLVIELWDIANVLEAEALIAQDHETQQSPQDSFMDLEGSMQYSH